MKQRPLIIQLIALGYLLNPVFFILQYFFFSQTSLTDTATWQSLFTPYKFICFIVLPPIVGFGIYKIRIWGWYLFLLHAFFIMGNNSLAYLAGSRTPQWAIIIFTLVTLVMIGVFVHSHVRAPYFNPRIRWWEAKPRYAITLKVDMGNDRTQIAGETYNVSEGGFFMVSGHEISIGEIFSIKLSRNGSDHVHGDGKIVWVNPAGQTLPQGFGVMFTQLNDSGAKEIRHYIHDLKKLLKDHALYR